MKNHLMIGGISEEELLQEMESLEVHGGLTADPLGTNTVKGCESHEYCGSAYCGNCVEQCGCTTPPPSRPVDNTSQCYYV